MNRASARVIGHIGDENVAEFVVFFRIDDKGKSVKQILDVRLVFKVVGGAGENKERTEDGEDWKTHLADW